MDFGRLITAMVTPFDDRLEVDYGRAQELALYLLERGSEGLVVCGTTGEAPTLSHAEKLQLFRCVKEAVGDRAAVIANTGSYCTADSVELTREAARTGVDGVMAVVPYYNNPPQEGLYRHFRAIAEATDLPVVLYNVPSRSPRNLEASTVQRLAEVRNIVAVKEASGKLDQAADLVGRTPASFRIYSGEDAVTLPLLGVGGHGVISVASHVVGPQMARMVRAFFAGQVSEAQEVNIRLLPIFRGLFATTNPILVKAALEIKGFPVGGLRLPLVPATEPERAALARLLEDV